MNLEIKRDKKYYFKKIGRVISYTLLTAFILIYLFIALLNTSIVQSILAAKISDYFSKEWKTTLRIGAMSVNIFEGVGLHDVFLSDKKGDTILLAKDISVNLLGLPSSNKVKIRSVKLDDVSFNLAIGEQGLNFGFIIDYFKSDKPEEEKHSTKSFVLDIRRCSLRNLNFSLRLGDSIHSHQKGLVVINNMKYNNITADLRNITLIKDSINLKIRNFSTQESSGLNIKNIAGEFCISPKGVLAKNANIRTPNSNIYFDAKMKTSSWHTYSHFIDSVYCEGTIKEGSIAGMKDATYWAETLKGFEQKASIQGKFYGKVSDLYFDEVELKTGKDTYIKTRGSIQGLPNSEHTIYDIYAENIITSYADYKTMQLGVLLGNLPIPDILANLGKIDMKARFCGLINNFDAAAQINTEIGDIDIIGGAIPKDNLTAYSADIVSFHFNIGQLLNIPNLTTSRFSAKAELCGNNLDNLKANLTAKFNDINFKNANYDTLFVDGNMIGREIAAKCFVNGDAVKLEANVEYVLGATKSIFLDANIHYAIPNKLNLYNFPNPNTMLSGKIKADFSDIDIKNLNGNLNIEDLKFKLSDTNTLAVNKFNLIVSSNKANDNNLKIYSDILDLSMQGNYSFDNVVEDFNWIIKKYIPNFDFSNTNKLITQDTLMEHYRLKSNFDYSIMLKDAQPLLTLLLPQMQLSKNTNIYGKCVSDSIFDLNIQAKNISYGNIKIDNLSLNSNIDDLHLNTLLKGSKLQVSDSIYMKNILLEMESSSKKIDLSFNFLDLSSNNLGQGSINLKFLFTEQGIQGHFEDSYFEIMGNKININKDNLLSFDGKKIAILNLELNKLNENISINGLISDQKDDKLDIDFKNVDISAFNPLLKEMGLNIRGRLNRNVNLSSVLDKPFFTSTLIVDSLIVNDNFLGLTGLNVSNTLSSDEFKVDIRFLYKGIDGIQNTPLEITGFIYPTRKEDNLDLNISMENFNIKVIENYLSSFASEIEGSLSGKDIKIKGSFTQPDIKGVLTCENGAMKINMINTKYFFTDKIIMDNNRFIFNNFTLKDIKANSIKISGMVMHDKFKDYYLNLQADADKINILNTKASMEQMYYGEAYASAKAVILGDLSVLNIDIKAKTEKGTKVTIPISSKTSVSQNSYIKFTNFNKIAEDIALQKDEDNGNAMELNLNVDLSVTPDAVLSFPMNFNQISGSLLASGQGDLRMDINNKGKFNMYGTINVASGTFNMSLMSVLDKTFQLEKGGSIQFNGKPMDGVVDISAVYKTKASLATILKDEEYLKPVDVHSIINLSGSMMNPVPKFDIRLPNTDAQTTDRLFTYIDRNNEKQMLEQTMFLLLRRQFYVSTATTNETMQDNTSLSSSAFELAFGQISGLLSNMITFVDVGLNYTPGTEAVSDQIDVNFSKSIGRWDIELNSVIGGKTREQAEAASSFVGDINAEYKITESFRFKIFNKSNANDFTKYNITPYTQGIGITYKKEYESFSDIFKTKKNKNNMIK